MNDFTRTAAPLGTAVLGRATAPASVSDPIEAPLPAARRAGSTDLSRSLAEVKGQAQFLLYLADQLEDSLEQLSEESDPGHATFLCKILGMYSAQLESKHVGLGDLISETCQEVYITVREHDAE
jgi:hypothetical protein